MAQEIDKTVLDQVVSELGGLQGEEIGAFQEILAEELQAAEALAWRSAKSDQDFGAGGCRPVFSGNSNGRAIQTIEVRGKKVTMSVSGGWTEPAKQDKPDTSQVDAGLYEKHLYTAINDPEDGAIVKAGRRFQERRRAKTSDTLRLQARSELATAGRDRRKRDAIILKYAKLGLDLKGL